MFSGHFEHAVDEKGRVAIPSHFRGALARLQDERLVLTKFKLGGQRCLDAYPLSAWRDFEQKLLAKNRFDPQIMRFKNVYVSGAHECPLDAQGRVLIPPLLRDYSGIQREAMITGDVDKMRIWAKRAWQAVFDEDEKMVLDDENFLAGLDL